MVERDGIRTVWKKKKGRKFPRAEEVTNRRARLAPAPKLHNWFWSTQSEISFIKASENIEKYYQDWEPYRRDDGAVGILSQEEKTDFRWKL